MLYKVSYTRSKRNNTALVDALFLLFLAATAATASAPAASTLNVADLAWDNWVMRLRRRDVDKMLNSIRREH